MEATQERRTGGWVIGRLGGAPVVVSGGWALTAAVLTMLLAPTVAAYEPGLGAGAYVVAAVGAVLLFGSAFLHEVAHALVARRRGVEVREIAVTLLGGHTELATPAPTPATSAVVALAGPAANIVLGLLAWLLVQALPPGGLLAWFAAAAAVSNGFVGVFNLVPGLPLDGGRVLEALVWRWTGRQSTGSVVAGWAGRLVALAVVGWAVVLPLVDGARPSLVAVAWSAMIGAFVWSGASQAIRGARTGELLDAIAVRDLMTPAVARPFTESMVRYTADAADGHDVVLVGPDGAPLAYVDPDAAASVPQDHHLRTPLTAVAVPLPPQAGVPVGLVGRDALEAVRRAAHVAQAFPVLGDDGGVVGLLRYGDVVAAVRRARTGAARGGR